MKGTPLLQARAGEYEVLADYTEGGLIHLLMRRPIDVGSPIYYYALPRDQVAFHTSKEVGSIPILVAQEGDEGMTYNIYRAPH